MNITELARILRISPQELKDLLPQMGFDIGQKAIKIDNGTAQRIIKEWPAFRRRLQFNLNRERQLAREEEKKEQAHKEVEIGKFINVKDFATLTNLPVNMILAKLMKNGVFVSLNEKIDFETAWLAGSELGIEVKAKAEDELADEKQSEQEKLKNILEQQTERLVSRPPVVVVMGHVDHGKTKLLDTIRSTNVIDKEAGGITQHIGAYQIERKGQAITFIDTPGHEAFTAMRGRGAKVADIAILVVAADDGVMQQTIEAYRIIEKAKLPLIVAINKIDKPEANIEKAKQELASKLNLTPEDWGGKTICVPVSARTGAGVEDILDMILLVNDVESANIKANPDAPAVGTVIESHVDKGAGPVATILIQNGTLRVGDSLCYNGVHYGKIRALFNHKGEAAEEAKPSDPAKILGLKTSPSVGDILEVGEGEKVKMKKIVRQDIGSSQQTQAEASDNIKKINLIIRGDVLGSIEAIAESLAKINGQKVRAEIIHQGLGNISESDIKTAMATGADVIGFNVKLPGNLENLAREKNVKVKMYNVIYHLINDIKEKMKAEIVPEIRRIDLGRLKILGIFRTEPKVQIVGGKVLDGYLENNSLVEIVRNKEYVDSGKITALKVGKEDVSRVEENQECGVKYEGNPVIQEGDILNFYKEEKYYGDL